MSVGLLEAAQDPRLLGAVGLWESQKPVLEAIGGGPRIQVLCLGRRSSKTYMAALAMVWDCLLRPELSERVRPGETRYAVAIATNLRQARLLVAAARSIAEASPALSGLIASVSEDEIRFSNDTCIAAFPCSSRGGRGWAISTLVLDEMAHFISETEGFQTADAVWQAMTPSVAQFGADGRIIVASTPLGPFGLFYDLFARARNGEIEDARAHHGTTMEMNPTLDPVYFVSEEARDPENYRTEFLAEFTGGGGAFVDMDRVAPPGRDQDVSPEDLAAPVVVGCDAAFSGHDLFGIAVIGRDPAYRRRLVVAHVDGLRPRKAASFDERAVVQQELLHHVAEICRRYGASAVIDQYASAQVAHGLQVHGVSVTKLPMTAQSKTAAYVEMRARLYSGELDIPDDPDLLADLRRLRTKITAGSSSVVVPRVGGSHGDRAQAVAIGCLRQAQFGAMGGDGTYRPLNIRSTLLSDPISSEQFAQNGGGGRERPGTSNEPGPGGGSEFTARQLRRPADEGGSILRERF
jgi:hypothetical protein